MPTIVPAGRTVPEMVTVSPIPSGTIKPWLTRSLGVMAGVVPLVANVRATFWFEPLAVKVPDTPGVPTAVTPPVPKLPLVITGLVLSVSSPGPLTVTFHVPFRRRPLLADARGTVELAVNCRF